MQANCPKCAQKIVIDDARVPERAFSVKCPKCQTAVKFQGKGAAAAAPPAPAPPAAEDPEPEPARTEAPAPMAAPVRRDTPAAQNAGRAVVALPDRGQAGAIASALGRQGYQVDTIDNADEGSRLIEQGVYDLVVTSRAAAPAGKESLYQRLSRLSPDARRRVFVVLVGDDFKTGDGASAWTAMADLVMTPRDSGALDAILIKTVEERTRLYQVYMDARRRFEASAG